MHRDTTDTATSSIYKKPPRGETHKPVSVSNDTHKKLMERQINMQFKLRRKVSLDEVIQAVLDSTGSSTQEKEAV